MQGTRKRSPFLILAPALLAMLGSVVATSSCSGGEPGGSSATPGTPSPPPLIERAIAALGGRDRLASVRSLVIESEGDEHGRPMTVRVALRFPDCYRQDVRTVGGHLVHAIHEGEAWATLDGIRVPLNHEEVQRIEEQIALQRLALLVGSEGDEDLEFRETGERDGLVWLRARIRGGSGPYRLGFSLQTALLNQAEWKTAFYGHRSTLPITARFADYREVEGIMVPYAASYRVEERPLGNTAITAVDFNPESLDAALFQPPAESAEAPVHQRSLRETPVAMIMPLEGDARNAEDTLRRYVEQMALARNGPAFRLVSADGDEVLGVGIPVELPGPLPEFAPRAGEPRLEVLPSREILTTVIIEPDDDATAAARERLLSHAAQGGLKICGPVSQVSWSDEIIQIQVPVRPGSPAREPR